MFRVRLGLVCSVTPPFLHRGHFSFVSVVMIARAMFADRTRRKCLTPDSLSFLTRFIYYHLFGLRVAAGLRNVASGLVAVGQRIDILRLASPLPTDIYVYVRGTRTVCPSRQCLPLEKKAIPEIGVNPRPHVPRWAITRAIAELASRWEILSTNAHCIFYARRENLTVVKSCNTVSIQLEIAFLFSLTVQNLD